MGWGDPPASGAALVGRSISCQGSSCRHCVARLRAAQRRNNGQPLAPDRLLGLLPRLRLRRGLQGATVCAIPAGRHMQAGLGGTWAGGPAEGQRGVAQRLAARVYMWCRRSRAGQRAAQTSSAAPPAVIVARLQDEEGAVGVGHHGGQVQPVCPGGQRVGAPAAGRGRAFNTALSSVHPVHLLRGASQFATQAQDRGPPARPVSRRAARAGRLAAGRLGMHGAGLPALAPASTSVSQ